MAPGGDADMRSSGFGFTGSAITPREGESMLWMSNTGTTPTSDYVNGLGERGTAGTIVTGPATELAVGDTVSLDWFFTSSDYAPYNDFAIGLISGTQLFSLTQTGGSELDGGWKTSTFTAPVAGTYQLTLVVSDQGDTSVTSDLYIDNVTGFTLPDEPGTVGPTVVSVAALGPGVSEADGFGGGFLVSREGDLSGDLIVNYFALGTAGAGVDYEALPGTVTIPAGESSAVIRVVPIQDGKAEPSESIDLFLDFGAGYEVSFPDTARVSLVDDDGGLAEVTVAATAPNASEAGSTPAVFTLTRAGDLSDPLTVDYTLSGGAKAGTDYQAPTGTVTFAAGEATATVTITPIDDASGEASEEVVLSLEFPLDFSYQVGYPYAAVAQIADDDGGPATVAFSSGPMSVGEGAAPVSVTLTRTGNLSAPLTVSYGVYGTAQPGVDYAALSESVTFAAGQDTATIGVDPTDDALGESEETIGLYLFYPNDGSYTVEYPGFQNIAIVDDDGGMAKVGVVASTPSVPEAGPGTAAFTFTRTGGNLDAPLTVGFFVFGGAEAGADFESMPTQVTFAAGQAMATVELIPIDDNLGEPNETAEVSLAWTDDGSYAIDFGNYSATATIVDDDGGLATVAIVATTPTVAEAGPGSAAFTITRTGGNLSEPLTVSYAFYGDAGFADFEMEALTGSVTFAAGATSVAIAITPLDDVLGEEDETVSIYLDTGEGYDIDYEGGSSADVAILDDDGGLALVTVATDAPNMEESGGSVTFTLTRTGGNLALPMDVNYFVFAQGAADYPGDIDLVSGLASFAAGESTTNVTFTAVDDAIGEADETISIVLGGSDDGSYRIEFGNNHAEAIILENDGGLTFVTIAAVAESLSEGGGATPAFVITRVGGNLDEPLTVSYTPFGNAQGDVDYEAIPGFVTIPAGETSVTVVITPIDDAVGEPDKALTLYLGADPTYEVDSSNDAATTLIADDDGGLPTLAIAADQEGISESGPTGTFTVTRTGGDLAAPLTVTYSIGGDALPDVDYAALSGTITFEAGQATATITIAPAADDEGESDEMILLELHSSDQYLLDYAASTHYAMTTIADDDGGLPQVKVAAATPGVAEGGPVAVFTVTRSGGTTDAPLTVTYGVFGGATAGADYVAPSGTVTIAAGETSATIEVTLLDDAFGEHDETILIQLLAVDDPTFQILFDGMMAEVALLDDDGGMTQVTIEATDAEASEAGDPGAITFTRTGGNQSLAMTVSISAFSGFGTATPGLDYLDLPATITFEAGQATFTLEVTPIDDAEVEGDEPIYVQVMNSPEGLYDFDPFNAFASIVIGDDDTA